jgi:hypothetical protein
MGWPLNVGPESYVISHSLEDCGDRTIRAFHSQEVARDFLIRLLDENYSMSSLRGIAGERHYGGATWSLSDHQVLDLVAWDLFTGELRIAERPVTVHSGGARRETAEPDDSNDDWPAPVPEEPRAPKPELPTEFGPQATTLIEAAREGVPFCEECEAARRALEAQELESPAHA